VALVMCSISKESIMSDYIYLQSFIDLLNDKFIHVNIKGMNCYCNITLCLHCKQVECGQLWNSCLYCGTLPYRTKQSHNVKTLIW
jgi:hypothetical protein